MINKCKICNKEILNDSQFIDGEWYHNECIKNIADKIEKQRKTLDKIKEYIKEEKEEYEKGKEDYKRIGIEDYTKGQLVAYKHIEKLLEEIE